MTLQTPPPAPEKATRFIQEFEAFKERYAAVQQQIQAQEQRAAHEFIAAFEAFKTRYQPVKLQAEKLERETAPRFNIFGALGVKGREIYHSRFLAYLLNPSSTHGQRHLFLNYFLTNCHNWHADFPLPSAPLDNWPEYRWLIETEKQGLGQDRLDIVIHCPELGYICVIENKVGAGEQSEQLERYSNWLDSEESIYPTQALIYLTPNGSASDTAAGRPYYRLSYREHIVEWLTKAVEETAAPQVRETIYQYIDVIRHL